MSELKNRIDFVYIFDVQDGNPNGDPDAGNLPRIDAETGIGLVTDVCLKRKVRNYVQIAQAGKAGNDILVKSKEISGEEVFINEEIRKMYKEDLGIELKIKEKAPADKSSAGKIAMCRRFFDVRTFGAVLSTGPNAGQVRGPIQMLGREELIAMVRDATVHNYVYLERDILAPALKILHVRGYEYTGYRARIYNMKSYFDENMRLLNHKNMEALFPPERPVYTKVRDEAPVRYAMDCKVHNSVVADGCIIEGEVENCVLFRGVRVAKGASIKNCVLMQGTVVEQGVEMEYIVTDKNVTITERRHLKGNENFPVYVEKGTVV